MREGACGHLMVSPANRVSCSKWSGTPLPSGLALGSCLPLSAHLAYRRCFDVWRQSSKMTFGDCGFHSCAVATRFNLQSAAELLHSFSHPGDANADRLDLRRIIQYSLRYSATFVTDCYGDSIEILRNLY